MLRSRKLKAPGPKVVDPPKCECGCEVYISLRPHPDMKEGACMAANGEEASIMITRLVIVLPDVLVQTNGRILSSKFTAGNCCQFSQLLTRTTVEIRGQRRLLGEGRLSCWSRV